ncbi:MAG: xylulokinase [Pseudomonadota bacterium]
MGLLLGIDVGSQSLKAVLLDERLQPLGSGRRSYPIAFPRPGWAEQDPALWEAALGPAIAEALAAAGRKAGEVAAIGIAGQLDGCIPVDANGLALHPCLIWMDRRAEASLAPVRRCIAPERVRELTGANLDGGHMAPKMRWLLDEVPAAKAARLFHQPVSYLVARLTGEAAIDHGLASTSLVYGLAQGDWQAELMAAFGLAPRLLPPLRRSEEAAGRLGPEGARVTGLPQGLPVAVGTGDDFSTPLGGGVMEEGIVANVLGTAEVVGALDRRPLVDPSALTETHRYVGQGFYYIENPGWVSGGALEWLRAMLGIADFAAFDRLAGEAPPGADGLLFLPALGGAMTPEWIAGARGCFYGLTPAHGAAHMVRAVLEGNAFGLKDVVDALEAMGVAAGRLRLLGGGARSDLWAQIRADVTGLPAERARLADASAVGAAMLGGVAAGLLPDLGAAAALVGGADGAIEPDPERHRLYAEAHARYRRLFQSLKPMFD